jgi:anti-sigma factor ChrR (cupin superfamily)
MTELRVDSNQMEWREAQGYTPGAYEKVLSEGNPDYPRVYLLKIPPGWKTFGHYHDFKEIHYILEGELECRGEIFPEGSFRILPPGLRHGPFSSETGALVMVTQLVNIAFTNKS